MSGLLDTSMVVRYLTGDPPELADLSAAIIDSDEPVFLSDVVILESSHVLRSVYGMDREVVVDALIGLIQRENVRVLHHGKDVILEALLMCRGSGWVAVGDALIWATARSTAHRVVYSLDGRFPNDGIEVRDSLA